MFLLSVVQRDLGVVDLGTGRETLGQEKVQIRENAEITGLVLDSPSMIFIVSIRGFYATFKI